jgi:ABC-type sugar transport system substrate-binding protein
MSFRSVTAVASDRVVSIVALLTAIAVAAVAATGASGSSSGPSSATATPLQEAKAVATAALKRPTAITVNKRVGKAIPAGKEIVYISCAKIEACTVHIKFISAAAKALGWKARMIVTDGSPQQVQAAFDSALRSGADGIISTGITRANLERQIQEARSKGVPFATCCAVTSPGNGIIYNTSTVAQNGKIGRYLAAWIVNDSGAKGGVVYVDISAFQILGALADSFEQSYKRWCSGCEFGEVDIPLTGLGKSATDNIVSYLRSHPSTKYVVLSTMDPLAPGLAAAIRAAGISGVKVLGQGPGVAQFEELRGGTIAAAVPFDFATIDWMMVDAIARFHAKAPVQLTAPPLWLVTGDNVPDTTGIFPIVRDYKNQFLRIWGKRK